MCKKNVPHKEASMGCVQETPHIKRSHHGMCERNSPNKNNNKKLSALSDCVKKKHFYLLILITFVGLLHVRVFLFFPFFFVWSFFTQFLFSVFLFCFGCWRAHFSLLSEHFSSFFPSCLSLVTALIKNIFFKVLL